MGLYLDSMLCSIHVCMLLFQLTLVRYHNFTIPGKIRNVDFMVVCVCVSMHTYKHVHTVQWKMLSVFLGHSPPHSFETGPLTEPGRRLMTNKPCILVSYLISSEFQNFVIEVWYLIKFTPGIFVAIIIIGVIIFLISIYYN